MLIRDGAALVRGADDVIEAIGRAPMPIAETPPASGPDAPRRNRSLAETARLHTQILSRLGPSPLSEDQLIRDINTTHGALSKDILPELVTLEMDGQIIRQPGGLLSKSRH